jgi:hypothetical protein
VFFGLLFLAMMVGVCGTTGLLGPGFGRLTSHVLGVLRDHALVSGLITVAIALLGTWLWNHLKFRFGQRRSGVENGRLALSRAETRCYMRDLFGIPDLDEEHPHGLSSAETTIVV